MTPLSRHRPVVVATLLVALVLSLSPSAGAAERSRLIVRGRVVDHRGAPIRDAWVIAKGSRRAASLVDTAGAYVLTLPGANALEMSRAPVRIRLQARWRAWRFALANGAPELGIEMGVVEDSAGNPQLLVRSNDPVVAALVANAAVLEASPQVILRVDFVGTPGVQEEVEAVDLTATQRVSFFAARRPAEAVVPLASMAPGAGAASSPGSGPGTAQAPRAEELRPTSGSGAASDRSPPPISASSRALARDPAAADSIDRLRRLEREAMARAAERTEQADRSPMVPDPVADPPRPVPAAPSDERPHPAAPKAASPTGAPPAAAPVIGADPRGSRCTCQVRGTVEIDSERPLNESLPVVIFLDDEPAASDKVELFMGPPRPFQLRLAASCGKHRVRFETRSKQRYRLTSLDPLVDCTGGGTRSIRLVLTPVGRGSPFR